MAIDVTKTNTPDEELTEEELKELGADDDSDNDDDELVEEDDTEE